MAQPPDLHHMFPNAAFIPFNPLMETKLKTAKSDPKVDAIICESGLPTIDGKTREQWEVENTKLPVLEVGCQDGHLFRDRGFTDWANWYGLDIDLWQMPNITQGDAHKLPFKSKVFNTVVFSEIAEHVEDPVAAFVEALRVCADRLIMTTPNEYMWGEAALPFMPLADKNKLDGISQRQQIDKNSRWLPTCLNPKDYVAVWDEEKFQHLWHHRHFYDPNDGIAVPSGRTESPEMNIFEYITVATAAFDAKYGGVTSKNWHYEKFTYFPWAFHAVIISMANEPFMTNWEFSRLFESDDDWYGQTFTGDKTLIGFLRRV